MRTSAKIKLIGTIVFGLALLALVPASLAAAGTGLGPDQSLLQGSWKVVLGTYSDGSLEKELDMSFTFTPTSLTNPMDGSSLAYTLDEKRKTILGTSESSTIEIVYKVVDKKTLDFLQMKVSAKGKTTVIVGAGGMFSSLRLGKK